MSPESPQPDPPAQPDPSTEDVPKITRWQRVVTGVARAVLCLHVLALRVSMWIACLDPVRTTRRIARAQGVRQIVSPIDVKIDLETGAKLVRITGRNEHNYPRIVKVEFHRGRYNIVI